MPVTAFKTPERYTYLNGFDSFHESESIEGALPIGANSPQKCPYGLYAEKLSGTAFTAPRHENLQTWFYRILPSAAHSSFSPYQSSNDGFASENSMLHQVPNQLRWDPFDLNKDADWIEGLRLVGGAGTPVMKSGLGVFIFAAGKDMAEPTAFYSSDRDFLIVLQHGIKYRVTLPEGLARGYILELYQGHFTLPELGPIGSNCLANPRGFQIPHAKFDEDTSSDWSIINKFDSKLFEAKQNHTPFDVVAWHGQYYPFKYDLGRFSVIGSTSFDHPDPSIYTVLTAPSDHPGTAVADFVVFPPRWLVQEDTFRPPWYHRNTMSEFMGLIAGDYDAKAGGGFRPAGASLHNIMAVHGPDAGTFEKASNAELKSQKMGEGSMAFMFESSLMIGVTEWGLKFCQKVQENYNEDSWTSLQVHFKKPEDKEVVDRTVKG